MSKILVRDFANGLDARRLAETTPPGNLIVGRDGQISRGGEFEKRAAFVPTYTLPAGTTGLAATASSIYVFGAGAAPAGMPAGVQYQQLVNFGGHALARVVSWDLFKGKLYAVGQLDIGDIKHYFDGAPVRLTGIGAYTVVIVAAGAPGDTVEIFVDGVAVMSAPVAWAGSAAATATAIAANINAFTSSPDYVADENGPGVFTLRAAVPGTAGNGRVVTSSGAITLFAGPLSSGTEPYNSNTRYVRTIGTKMYTLSGPDLQFSAVGNPSDWDGQNGGIGFGFIDTSAYTPGSENLAAVVEYRGSAAVFSQRAVQIWTVNADPAKNSFVKAMRNTGTSCPKSITQFGDADVYFLDETGVRSVRARDWSNAAATTGVGVRIDPLIVAKLRSMTDAERERVIGLIEPQDGRFWLIMKDAIFVLSNFDEEGIRAWTMYAPGFDIDDAVVFHRRVYVRSGDTIYVYGGLETGQATDVTVAEAWTAYLDGDNPTEEKNWQALDVAAAGEWSIAAGMNLADIAAEDRIAIVTHTTYSPERIPMVGASTHVSLRFRSQGSGPAKIGASAVRFERPYRGAGRRAAAVDRNAWTPAASEGSDLETARVWQRSG